MEGRENGIMEGRMDEWMEGRKDVWVDKRMDGWVDRWKKTRDECMYACMHAGECETSMGAG